MGSQQADPRDLLERSLIELAVDTWRLSRLFARVVNKLDAGDQARYANQFRFLQKQMEEHIGAAGFSLVSVEGHTFEAGIAASPVNLADFQPDESLIVDQMVEPIVIGRDGLRRQGTVILRKAQE